MSLKDSLKIMVVDDMSVSRGLIIQALEEIGIWNHVSENDGASALQRLASTPVHLIISDQNMPNLDGMGLLKGIRSNRNTQQIGFILVTGSPTPQLIETGKALGMNNMIKKPFTTESMKQCIERVVGKL